MSLASLLPRLAAGALTTLLLPAGASAWGSSGHRAIGEIASHYLSPEAERAVEALLEPGPYDTLATAGYWADSHARLYRSYDDYIDRHYVNVDPSAETVDLERDCPEDCVLRAIATLSERLRDRSRYSWERAQDLRFLVHFVEDLHQPLHVVHPDGKGGNRTDVTLFGVETNLHAAWDYGLIGRRLEAYPPLAVGGREIPAWKRWAWELRMGVEPSRRDEWTAETDPLVWAAEGIGLARRLTFDVASGEDLGESYYEAVMPVIEDRIVVAATRLAALLNQIFADDS